MKLGSLPYSGSSPGIIANIPTQNNNGAVNTPINLSLGQIPKARLLSDIVQRIKVVAS